MTGFSDIIDGALPFLKKERIEATQGTTWSWGYELKDDVGDLVDLTSGYTATMVVCSSTGAVVLTATVTFPAAGEIRCTATPTATAAVAPGNYIHELTVTRTSDGAKVIVVGADGTKFTVKKKVS